MAIEQPPILLGPPAKLELQECGIEHRTAVPFMIGDLYPARAAGLLTVEARHRPVFEAIHGLQPGEAIRLNVDHDPQPLLEIVAAKHPGLYAWEPLLQGPKRWVGLLRRRPADTFVATGGPIANDGPIASDSASSARTSSFPTQPSPAVHRLPSRLDRRAAAVGARIRLERELRSITADLLGAFQPGEVPAATAAWVGTATEAAVRPVRDASLGALMRALEVLLEAAPPEVRSQLQEARERQETGLA